MLTRTPPGTALAENTGRHPSLGLTVIGTTSLCPAQLNVIVPFSGAATLAGCSGASARSGVKRTSQPPTSSRGLAALTASPACQLPRARSDIVIRTGQLAVSGNSGAG